MSQTHEGRTMTGLASGVLAENRRIRLDSNGLLAYCSDADTDCIGVTVTPAFAVNDPVDYVVRTAQGTVKILTSGAMLITDTAYAATNGRIAASGSVLVGKPMEAVSSGAVCETMLSPAAILGGIARSALTEDALQVFPVSFGDMRIFDNVAALLGSTHTSADDLAIIDGTIGTAPPSMQTGDIKTANSAQKARFAFPIPENYMGAQGAKIRVNAGMITTVSDTTATVDISAYRRAAPTVDICATAAQSCNSLTPENLDFVLTNTDLVAGDVIDALLTVAYHDAATATPVIAAVYEVDRLLDVKG